MRKKPPVRKEENWRHEERWKKKTVQCGTKPTRFEACNHPLSHELGSELVREWDSEQCGVSEWVSGASKEQTDERVTQFLRFFVVPDQSAIVEQRGKWWRERSNFGERNGDTRDKITASGERGGILCEWDKGVGKAGENGEGTKKKGEEDQGRERGSSK